MIIARDNTKINWVFGMQDPINIWLDRWYVKDADGVVYVE